MVDQGDPVLVESPVYAYVSLAGFLSIDFLNSYQWCPSGLQESALQTNRFVVYLPCSLNVCSHLFLLYLEVSTDEDGIRAESLGEILRNWPQGEKKPRVLYTVPVRWLNVHAFLGVNDKLTTVWMQPDRNDCYARTQEGSIKACEAA